MKVKRALSRFRYSHSSDSGSVDTLERYLTLGEAAVVLRCSNRTMYRYIRVGKLSFMRIGKRYLFSPQDLRLRSQKIWTVADVLS